MFYNLLNDYPDLKLETVSVRQEGSSNQDKRADDVTS